MIINLTQHSATVEQVSAGVVEPERKDFVKMLLTFEGIPSKESIYDRAISLAEIARDAEASFALIGGAPYLMSALERALIARNITPVYSFSERVSVETTGPDGTVKKVNEFRHKGFIEV